MNLLNKIIVAVMVMAYGLALYFGFTHSPQWAFILVIVPAIGFALVTFWRKQVNAARPYEVAQTSHSIEHKGTGESFPSRHCFSAFCIAWCWLCLSAFICAALTVLACALALLRVRGGVHYVKDVIVGALCGIVIGAIASALCLYL